MFRLPKISIVLGAGILFFAKEGACLAEALVTTCRNSKGFAYYTSPIRPDLEGWRNDGVAGGKISLFYDSQVPGGYSISIIDSSGVSKNVLQDGREVYALQHHVGLLSFEILNEKVIELYAFFLESSGKGKLFWSQIKENELFSKTATYEADCSR